MLKLKIYKIVIAVFQRNMKSQGHILKDRGHI